MKTSIWSAVIAAVVLLVFVSVCAVMSAKSSDSPEARLLPVGQFQADARTLVAALGFLLESTADSAPQVTNSSAVLCASNFGVQPLTSAAFCCASNQSDLFSELITNAPARS